MLFAVLAFAACCAVALAADQRGTRGNDRLVGTPGPDRLYGRAGNDPVGTSDRFADRVASSPGRDTVRADARDDVAGDCEIIRR
jgi:hypothetical protein